MMKKIKDERLQHENLNNIRIVYIIQTIGIFAILVYDLVTKGVNGMTENPLWIVLLVATVTSTYLNMSISVDNETVTKSPKRGLNISILILILVSIVIGIFVAISDGFNMYNGLVMGGIIFICGLVPVIYIYHLRKKRSKDSDI
ncbi:hypothetical protein [Tetragenococcus halophilus]|uniref:Uncharacterized protein n=2 Tax=Tetragenococcus halophilus TaxID=51669 RepID=A0A2H6DNH3_TETHA|nr:hypothetical protein [Tetragenococcus halophilus]MDN6599278.1 hypothetical protein [Tetragenococcus koreensis]MCF1602137.1 hypothetical protein [Tetragenococcus halophilus]MCO7026774.1 hypothetical protein [Tetragenococcus halophilus]GBD64158.1 hypothetical protein TEHD23766T_1585 [Tetragenococcus halophilus subsp. flandriensis]GBD66857.1 hypothetical protein TEHN7116_1821 [Tetragenococcus halophilus subsp. halophilus]